MFFTDRAYKKKTIALCFRFITVATLTRRRLIFEQNSRDASRNFDLPK